MKIAVIVAGNFYQKGRNLVDALDAKENIQATLINPRYLSGIDEQMLHDLQFSHQVVVTLEDGCLDGGFGERIARYYGPTQVKRAELRYQQATLRPLRRQQAHRGQ